MKYLRQFGIILFFSFLGELLHILLPLPVPTSVYGLVLMLTALCTGILKPAHIKETASFLIEIMPVMFIPAAAGLLDVWPSLQPIWLPVILITVITTIIVMEIGEIEGAMSSLAIAVAGLLTVLGASVFAGLM